MSPTPTRAEIQAVVTEFATASPQNRLALIEDPKRVIEELLGVSLGSLAVKAVVQTDANAMTVVVPYVLDPDELEPVELDAVAGGGPSAAFIRIRFMNSGPIDQ